MKTLFCLSDVHSFYDEMIDSLNKAGYDKNNTDHIIVHCGDLLDRGPQALKCLKFINSIPENRKILIKGNHEDLLDDVLNRGFFCSHDLHNATTDTVEQLSEISLSDMLMHELTLFGALDKVKHHPEWVKYSRSLRDYCEIGSYIFVHGWVPNCSNNEDWRVGCWKEARWDNGMKLWSYGYKIKDKIVVCGHWHTSWGHSKLHNYGLEWDDEYYENASDEYRAHFEPFIDDGIVALDSCVAYSGMLNCYKIEIEDSEWP